MINNKAALAQARAGIIALIKMNQQSVTMYDYPEIDNGFGVMVPDSTDTPVETIVKCKISHKRQGPFHPGQSPAGITTDNQRYILVNYKTTIKKHGFFTDTDNNEWRIGHVDILRQFEGVIGYQAILKKINEV